MVIATQVLVRDDAHSMHDNIKVKGYLPRLCKPVSNLYPVSLNQILNRLASENWAEDSAHGVKLHALRTSNKQSSQGGESEDRWI